MQACTDTSEAVELFRAQGLYLKPTARVSICVQLPLVKTPCKSISNWEVMEKLKAVIRPDELTVLKVTKSTLEFIRFEGEAETKAAVKTIVARLEGKSIKLSGFPDALKVRAVEAKVQFPSRHDWDSYFRDAKNVNEMKPGERPDTVHLQNLPCKWFASSKEGSDPNRPSEYVLRKVFETYGEVRLVDIPMNDPYLREIKRTIAGGNGAIQTFSFSQDLAFEAFVQYVEYIGFVKAMTELKGMKLLRKEGGSNDKCFTADIKVDFDKTKHLTEENIRKRQIERDKLAKLEKAREDRVHRERKEEERKKEEERRRREDEERDRELKRAEKIRKREERRREREMKRAERVAERRRKAEEQRLADEKAFKERQALVEHRRTEAARLFALLLRRIEEDRKREDLKRQMQALADEQLRQLVAEERKKAADENRQREYEERRRMKLAEEERSLRERLLKNLKTKAEQREEEERERRRREIAGKTKLRSVLVVHNGATSPRPSSSSVAPKLKSRIVPPR